jgi:hypothetical protein
LLASLGCPYSCDFCIDGRRAYRAFDSDALRQDLAHLARRHPGTRAVFHDPNFAVRFDETLGVIESLPPAARPPFAMQASLAILRADRARRLAEAGCTYVAPSLESWSSYGDKAGASRRVGEAKLAATIEEVREIGAHVPGVQINMIYGLDEDGDGREHAALTRRFVAALPEVFVTATIAMPYGGTELHERLMREGRILRGMPLALSYMPHLATVPVTGDARTLYDQLIAFFEQASSWSLLRRRLTSRLPLGLKALHGLRSQHARARLRTLRAIRHELEADSQLAAFHRGERVPTPARYREAALTIAGPYASLLGESLFHPIHKLEGAQTQTQRMLQMGRGSSVSSSGVSQGLRS